MTIPVWTEKAGVGGGIVYIIIGGLVMPFVLASGFVEQDEPMPTYTKCTAPLPTYVECSEPAPTWTEKVI